jgi:hypothetical protein
MLLRRPAAALLVLVYATSLLARGQVWDFLGHTEIDGSQDHGKIQIVRRGQRFQSIQLRTTGEPIFFDRLVFHFADGTSEEFVVSGRISSEGKSDVFNLSGERSLEYVDLWYYKESWGHNPRVSLYGIHLPYSESKSIE